MRFFLSVISFFLLAACERTDLVFLLDHSSSIKPSDHVIMTNFTADIVNNFEIGEKFARVGLAQFSHLFRHEFYLKSYFRKEDVVSHIMKVEYTGGNTHIGNALREIKGYFSTSAGSRSSVPKTLVIISDGNSHDDVEDAADDIRNLGIEILAIAVGDVYNLQLLQITGTPKKVFTVQNFNSLANIKKDVFDAICKDPSSSKLKSHCDSLFGVSSFLSYSFVLMSAKSNRHFHGFRLQH